jgi:membrane-associated protein
VGFFLPGDSLLFTAGLMISTKYIHFPLWLFCLVVTVSAVAGDQVGYYIGKRAGPAVFRREDSRLFRQEYVEKAYAYFDRYGARTIVLARFVPIVRTFAPVVAGVGHMRYRTFVTYNIVGGVAWGTGVSLLGYFLGRIDIVREHIEFIAVGIVALSLIPIAIEFLRHRAERRRTTPEERAARETARTAIGRDRQS